MPKAFCIKMRHAKLFKAVRLAKGVYFKFTSPHF